MVVPLTAEVVVVAFLASLNESAGVHAEIRTRVYQELPFTEPVRDEEAGFGCNADICRR
jgi:hypothetical protein